MGGMEEMCVDADLVYVAEGDEGDDEDDEEEGEGREEWEGERAGRDL